MSVGRRLMVNLSVLVACCALLGALAIGGLLTIGRRYDAAEAQYRQLRALYEIGFRSAMVRQMLQSEHPDIVAVQGQLLVASREASGLSPRSTERLRASIDERLQDVAAHVQDGAVSPSLRTDANRWLAEVSALVSQTQERIVENRQRVGDEMRATVIALGSAMLVIVLVAVTIGWRQYRSVMRPLRALDSGMVRMAGTEFAARIPEEGDAEFRRLMREFNRMSESIQRLHASLRDDVEMKSRQLIRSEQLAAVGSLAAGLAHEINNPLGIIAGHAQVTARKLDRATTPEQRDAAAAAAQEALRLIAEESFRARDIALQLLRMAEPGEADPEAVDLRAVTRKAVELARRLPVASGKEVTCETSPTDASICRGHGPQLLQVVLNLITNAMEACPPGGGRIVVSVGSFDGIAAIEVCDNGCGMDDATLSRAFEPFFSGKRERGHTGSGLGLWVSHEIVRRHGGRLLARSDGPGRGSLFRVELPEAAMTGVSVPAATEDAHVGAA